MWGINRERKGTANSLAALQSIRAARPDGAPIYVILDNLSVHTGPLIRRWARRNKVRLCFTPTNASWANPIEARFGPLRQFTLANSQHPKGDQSWLFAAGSRVKRLARSMAELATNGN